MKLGGSGTIGRTLHLRVKIRLRAGNQEEPSRPPSNEPKREPMHVGGALAWISSTS